MTNANISNTRNAIDWMPNPSMLAHEGTPVSQRPQDIEFFAAPPPELGEIWTISSTLTRSKQPPAPALKYVLVAAIMLVTLVLGALAWMATPVFFFFFLAGGIFLSIWLYGSLSFTHQCSFVGENGIALYRIKGSRSTPVWEEKLLFRDVGSLYTQQTRHYYNGVYTGTEFTFQFARYQDQPYKLAGRYHDDKRWSKANDLYFYARSAEHAWTSYFMGYVNDQFNRFGYVEFAMAGNPKAVRVGEGYLEFMSKDNTTAYVAVADMRKISLNNGMFYFEHKDSTWWQGKGKYSFAYGTLPNARAFLICLDKLAGIRWN
jgi:hypothetical protein